MAKKTAILQNIFFLLGIALLGWMVYRLGIETIWEHLRQTGWWFVGIIGLWIFVYGFNAISFHLIIRDGSPESKRVSFWRTFQLTISGYAINYITPFGLLAGEPYRIFELKNYIGVHKATSSVLLYAMMHFVTRFIFWIVAVPVLMFLVPNIPMGVKITLTVTAVVSLILLVATFMLYNNGFILKSVSLGTKLPFVGKKISLYKEKNEDKLHEMDRLIADLYRNRKKDFLLSFITELISRYIWCAEVMLMVYPIGLTISYAQSVIAESVASMMGNIMFFMPMQLGAREGGFVLAFTLFSLAASHGVYVSLCTRIRELAWTIIGFALMKLYPSAKR